MSCLELKMYNKKKEADSLSTNRCGIPWEIVIFRFFLFEFSAGW